MITTGMGVVSTNTAWSKSASGLTVETERTARLAAPTCWQALNCVAPQLLRSPGEQDKRKEDDI